MSENSAYRDDLEAERARGDALVGRIEDLERELKEGTAISQVTAGSKLPNSRAGRVDRRARSMAARAQTSAVIAMGASLIAIGQGIPIDCIHTSVVCLGIFLCWGGLVEAAWNMFTSKR